MKVGIWDLDGKIPNLALMKISSWHKALGDNVNPYLPSGSYDKIYCSSIFTFSDKSHVSPEMICGGTGFDIKKKLPKEIDCCVPDRSLYPDFEHPVGFLTRGCIRDCDFCFVREKEGFIQPYRDIEEIVNLQDESAILLDNNVLSSEYGISQIEKISKMKLKIDFNQGLDARLINNNIAKLLSKVKWLSAVRMSCDSVDQIAHTRNAIELLRWNNCTPRRYFIYVLIKEIDESLEIIKVLKGMNVDVFAQPYRDKSVNKPTKKKRDFARWVNHKAIFKSVLWEDYKKEVSR